MFYTGGSVVTSPQVSKMPHVQGLPVIEVDLFEKHAWRKVVNRSSRNKIILDCTFHFGVTKFFPNTRNIEKY